MITGVAVKFGRVIIDLPKPNRHGDILNLAAREFDYHFQGECGFITENGVFLNRLEAWDYAEQHGQPISGKGGCPGRLFSEDLW